MAAGAMSDDEDLIGGLVLMDSVGQCGIDTREQLVSRLTARRQKVVVLPALIKLADFALQFRPGLAFPGAEATLIEAFNDARRPACREKSRMQGAIERRR